MTEIIKQQIIDKYNFWNSTLENGCDDIYEECYATGVTNTILDMLRILGYFPKIKLRGDFSMVDIEKESILDRL